MKPNKRIYLTRRSAGVVTYGRRARRLDAVHCYIQKAIVLENSGKKPIASGDTSLEHPEELIQMFEVNPDFEEAFSALTPGRQRGYLIHFTSAKQSKTRTARIEKSMPKIFSGKGWNER